MKYNKTILSTKEQEQEQSQGSILEQEAPNHELILFNDEVNTFDWVIESLIDVCEHEEIQAEQCAFVVHYKGKCSVKSGDFDSLEPIQRELSNRNLSVEIS